MLVVTVSLYNSRILKTLMNKSGHIDNWEKVPSDAAAQSATPQSVTQCQGRGCVFFWCMCTIPHFLSRCHCCGGWGERGRARERGREWRRERRNGSGKKNRVAAPGGNNCEGGLVAGESKLGGRHISSGSMAQSAANGVDQDLASKRLHSR